MGKRFCLLIDFGRALHSVKLRLQGCWVNHPKFVAVFAKKQNLKSGEQKMFSSYLAEALLHNNQGAIMVEGGHYQAAGESFARSLAIVHELLAELPQEPKSGITSMPASRIDTQATPLQQHGHCIENNMRQNLERAPPETRQRRREGSQFPTRCDPVNPFHRSRSRSDMEQSHDNHMKAACASHPTQPQEHFIFKDPIEIPIDPVLSSLPSQRLFMKVAVIAIYNLALSHHLLACQVGDMNTLHNARMLYEYAFQIHLEEKVDR